VYQRSGDSSQVSREEVRKFKQAWAKFDPDGHGYIPIDKFPRLLAHLSGIFAMRIYEDPFTVHSILDDVRVDPNSTKGLNSSIIVEGIDLEALNRRISMIPVHKIRRQRHTFTLFFEECLVSADKEYGVSFESVLLILAHYKIINDNKSLRYDTPQAPLQKATVTNVPQAGRIPPPPLPTSTRGGADPTQRGDKLLLDTLLEQTL